MEDGLVLTRRFITRVSSSSLNPYCSGRWSRTWQSRDDCWKLCLVLILVVVDEGIVQIVEGSERKEVRVLILVIVEDGLVQTIETLTQYGNAKRS